MSWSSKRSFAYLALLSAGLAGACQPADISKDSSDMGQKIPEGVIRLTTGPIELAAGQERTVCVVGRFPLTVAVDVTKISTQQTGSHHVIFYRYVSTTDPPLNDKAEDCAPLDLLTGGQLKAPLFIGESADPAHNNLELPAGVVYHFEPDDYYKIEVHILNASPQPATREVDVYLTPTAPNDSLQRADMMFLNNTKGLNRKYDGMSSGLPPLTKTTIDAAFTPVDSDAKIFALTTHQHHLGTSVTAAKSTSVSDVGTTLLTNTDWEHPALYRLPDSSPLTFKNDEGLRWVCSYDNTTNNYVKFGQSAKTDEMCIIWAYYYPSSGFRISWQ